ncbi:uncharacterized protein LOC131238853 [Magnolia sinica]|uniref:uncharacterized protein LOC131238853 n=1 Tax=Magnolia sinica TaxID=86752 RepID=UPI00265AC965|nr:uncharacterized protein LOC131238853 [Magnolia sinica]
MTSLICLIPKSPTPKRFSDYHPVSLCNCFYKIFVKILAAKLSQVLPSLISPEQGTFVGGRVIAENIALSQELFKELNWKFQGGNIVLKLDMDKAYDRVNWDFLKQVSSNRRGGYVRVTQSPLAYSFSQLRC